MTRISKPPDVRKKELMNIGLTLFLAGGAKAVSIRKVVQQANVANGLFYYYFETKEDFIDELIEDYVINFIGKLEDTRMMQNMSVETKLDTLLNQYIERYYEANNILHDEATNTPQHLMLEGMVVDRLIDPVTDFIIEGTRNGIFCVNEPSVTARFIVGGLAAILRKSMTEDKEITTNEITRLVTMALGKRRD